jgi:hypothetical protein
MLVIDILLNLAKIMYREEEEMCTFLTMFVLTHSELSFDPQAPR